MDRTVEQPRGYRPFPPGTQPDYLFPPYRSTVKRSPSKPLILLPHAQGEISGPVFGWDDIKSADADLTKGHAGDPLGERITVTGRVIDEFGRPMRHTLVEIWQANASGRYLHKVDQHHAPLDPNFTGCGRTLTDGEGVYRFTTIRPGAYPWHNHDNAWRPAHIHFSLFGESFAQRLVTQMYFPGDPLMDRDPMYLSIPNEDSRRRLISTFDWDTTVPHFSLGYRFDIVLRGRKGTPFEEPGGH